MGIVLTNETEQLEKVLVVVKGWQRASPPDRCPVSLIKFHG